MAFLSQSYQRNIEHALQHHFQHTEKVKDKINLLQSAAIHYIYILKHIIFFLLAIIIPILDRKQNKAISVLMVRPPPSQHSIQIMNVCYN